MLFQQKFYQSMWVTISSTILVKPSQKFEFKIYFNLLTRFPGLFDEYL